MDLTNIAFRSEKLGANYKIETEEKKGLKFEIMIQNLRYNSTHLGSKIV